MAVVIVDDDEWVRRGRAQALDEIDGIRMAAALSHREALDYASGWDAVDVVLVDAWDDIAGWDRFPGVGVVEAVRVRRTKEQTTVVVITGHILNDLLRERMAEAGADFYYSHGDVRSPEQLAQVVLHPEERRRDSPAGNNRRGTRPNATLAYLRQAGLEDAFEGTGAQKSLSLSRRAIMRTRAAVTRISGLSPRADTGGETHTSQAAPWHDVVRFVNKARGVDIDP